MKKLKSKLKVAHAKYFESAKSIENKPSFGIDILPVGLDSVNKNKIPTSISGTFYDLFSPATTKAEERKIIQDEIKEKTGDKGARVKLRGNPKNFYTFKAMFKTYLDSMLDEVLSGYNVKRSAIPESQLNNYFTSNASKLADDIIVKRVGLNFEITLPLYNFTLLQFSTQLNDAMTDNDEITKARQADEEFARSFWKRKFKTFPFNTDGTVVDVLIDKTQISPTVNSKYPKAIDFYKKYLRNYKLSSNDKLLKQKAPEDKKTFALPAPSNSNTEIIKSPFKGYNDVRVLNQPSSNNTNTEDTTKDNIAFGKNILNAEFLISAVVLLPYEEARFYVQSEHPKEVEILDFIHSWYTQAMPSLGAAAYPTYKHSMVSVREKNKPFVDTAVKTTNADKLALTKQNRLIYLPDVELIDEYRQNLINATWDGSTDTYSFRNRPANLPRYKLIYVDWVNKRVAYTTAGGKLFTLNLSVLYKVNATNYYKELNTHVNQATVNYISDIVEKAIKVGLYKGAGRSVIDKVYELAKKYNYGAAQSALHDSIDFIGKGLGERAALKFCYSFVEYANSPEYLAEDQGLKIDSPLYVKDLLLESVFEPVEKMLYQIFISIFNNGQNILTYVNNSMSDVPTSLMQLAFLMPFKHISKYSSLLEASARELAPYRDQENVDIGSPIKIKNFDGVDIFLRHQAKAFKKLQKKPPLAIIAASAGGGKTLITIADILNNLADGTVKKPLVLCPNGLIKDYINETNFAGKGKINAVPFDTVVFNNYANAGTDADGNVTWDYSKLKALVDQAPINTIFILGYDVIAGSTSNKEMNVYGNDVYESYSHLEFFASCNFDGVWCDESHYLKGGDSLRVAVNEILIVPIPFKRLLTGTIVPNNLVDLVRQMMLLDPSILGTESQFRKAFDIEGRDSGVFSPRKGAIEEIQMLLKQQCTFINIQRKEWAAILPQLHEYTVEADLTENQTKVYKHLINIAVDKLENNLTEEEKIALMDDSSSEESDEKVERIFDRAVGNLAAVEAFLANPASIKKELQQEFYNSPEDLISPKGKAVVEIIRRHLAEPEKYVGKILVFCNTHAAVAGIWNSLPADIKAKTIYYSSKKKADFERQFKTDDTKRILIGVSDSLDTGLNLQIADTIIRVDCVWTPGKLEQGNARINRPSLKNVDENGNRYDVRKANGIHVYYVMVDRTIDTIKYAKLTSKTVTLAKFYNAGTADFKYYENIGLDEDGDPIVPLKVSLELLREGLSWEQMGDYKVAYEELRQTENQIYEEYAAINPEDLAPITITHDGLLPDSKVLRNVPYIAGAGIFNNDQLGLMPYLQYKEEFITEHGEEAWNPEGLLVHTELGEGTVIKETGSTVHLRMDSNGIRVPKNPSVIFVVTKKLTSTMEIRDQLVKTTGLESVDIQLDTYRNAQRSEKKSIRDEKEKIAQQKREAKQAIRERKEQEAEERKNNRITKLNPVEIVQEDDTQEDEEDYSSEINLKFTPINEMLGLTIESEDPESEISMFKQYGFVLTKPYLAGEIKRKDALTQLLDKMHKLYEKGDIEMPQEVWDMWSEVEHEFSQGRSKLLQVVQTPKAQITNFLRTNYRRVRTPETLRALPMIVDGKLYMVIDINSHVATTVNKVRRQIVSGVTWEIKPAEMLGLYTTKSSMLNAIKQMKNDGWTIENEKDLKHYFNITKVKSKGR